MVIIIPTFKNERRRSQFVIYSVQYLCTNAKQYEGRTSEPLLLKEFLVGVAGFEPATPSSRTRCATRLRYTPTSEHDPEKACPEVIRTGSVFEKIMLKQEAMAGLIQFVPRRCKRPDRFVILGAIRKNACARLDPTPPLAFRKKI